MTKQQAIENIKNALPNAHAFKEEFEALENNALRPARKLGNWGSCPGCNTQVFNGWDYCPCCGQALDWSE